MKRIVKNAIKCNHCGDIIISTYRHDFVTCSCGCCSVDGGNDYLRRGYTNSPDDFTDMSEFEEDEKKSLTCEPHSDGNGRTGRLILFRECLKNGIVPVVIEDANRNKYLESLKEYREEKSLNKLITLFEKEQRFYFEKCKYFM